MHTIISSRFRRIIVFALTAGFLAIQHFAVAQFAWGPLSDTRSDGATDTRNDAALAICPGNQPGVINALWVVDFDGGTNGGALYRARSTNHGQTWSAPVMVRDVPTYSFVPRLAQGMNGVTIGVWHRATMGYVEWARSTDAGLTWSSALTLSSVRLSYSPSLATDKKGTWVMAHDAGPWSSGGDPDISFMRSTDNGQTWSGSAVLSSSFNSDGTINDGPCGIDSDGNGVWVITWMSSSVAGPPYGPVTMLFSRSTDNGATWSASAPVSTQSLGLANQVSRLAANPGIQTDGKGNWVIVGHSLSGIGGSGSDFDIVCSRSSNNGVTWSSFEPLNSDAIGDSIADAHPILRTDRSGTWIAEWNNYGTAPNDDLEFAKSTDNGVTWTPGRVVNQNHATSAANAWDCFADSEGRWFSSCTTRMFVGGDDDPAIAQGIPDVNILPSPAELAAQDIDAGPGAPVTLTIKNDGLATCTLESVSITGPGAAAFSFDTPPDLVTLLPDESTTCAVRFDPSATGLTSAALTIVSDYVLGAETSIALNGIGIDQEIAVAGGPLAFADRDLDAGQSTALPITIENVGTAPLNFTGAGIQIVGAGAPDYGFVAAPVTSSLAVGTSRVVEIVFDPSIIGARNASLQITTDDTDEATVDVPISGTGLDQEITVGGSSLDFGGVDIDAGPSTALTVTIANDGNAPLNFTGAGIEITGTDAAQFAFQSAPAITPLAPGTSRDVGVIFDPAALGSKSAALRITTDDTSEPTIDVTLTGSGIDQEITVTPAGPIDLGFKACGATPPASCSLTIHNDGTAPLQFTGIGIQLIGDASQFQFVGVPDITALAVGAERNIGVSFEPTTQGRKNASVVINTNDSDEPAVTVSLSAYATDPLAAAMDWGLFE